jgi:hypothetical protein
MHTSWSLENLKGRGHLEDLVVGNNIKMDVKNMGV